MRRRHSTIRGTSRKSAIFLLSILILSILFSNTSFAAKESFLYSEIEGQIVDMWIDLHQRRCCFKILITEGTPQYSYPPGPERDAFDYNTTSLEGETIVADVSFYNASGEDRLSSKGWRIGDHVNGTIIHSQNGYVESYSLALCVKSEINYADTLTFGIKTTQFAIIVIVVGILTIATTTYLYSRRKKRKKDAVKKNEKA